MAAKLPRTGDANTDRAFELVQEDIRRLDREDPKSNIRQETFVVIGADLLVRHALGYPPQGYHIWRQNGPGSVYDGSPVAAPYTTDQWINLRCDRLITVTIEFF